MVKIDEMNANASRNVATVARASEELFQSITEIETPEDKKGKVVDEVEKGYYLNDKIIRFAKVVVGK